FVELAPAWMLSQAAHGRAQNAAATLEARGVWLHPENLFDADPAKGKEQVRAMVRRLGDAHFNLILPWIKSDYLVALEDAEYRKKHPTAGWDALGALIEEATRAGISVQLWYAFTEYRSAGSPDFDPRVGGNPQWAARRIDEMAPDPKTGKIAARR